MKKKIVNVLTAMALAISLFSQNEQLVGKWSGMLKSPMGEIQLMVEIAGSPLSGRLSTSTGIQGVGLDEVTFKDNELSFELKALGARYEGIFSGDSIVGKWMEIGQQVPLVFLRKEIPALPEKIKTQTPMPPFSYTVTDISFQNEKAGITFSGTLTMPFGEGPFPAVILLSVAGANDRNQSHGNGHEPFHVLADFLTENGFAVLRFDDRGVGDSGGNLMKADFKDLTEDALAAQNFLAERDHIDPDKIGFIGNSEGSIIGAKAAIQNEDIAFVVMLGAVGVPLSELTVDRLERMRSMYTLDVVQKEEIIRYWRDLSEILTRYISSEEQELLIRKLDASHTFDKPGFPNYLFFLPTNKEERIQLFLTPWYKAQISYQPNDVLSRLTCPTLIISGTLDVFQHPTLNFPPIMSALFQAGNEDFTMITAPDINHIMQTAQTGLPTEYATLEESFSPVIMQVILDWMVLRME